MFLIYIYISYQCILTFSSREVKDNKTKSSWGHEVNKFIVTLISMYLSIRVKDKHKQVKAGPEDLIHTLAW